jgi:hypothetical protein
LNGVGELPVIHSTKAKLFGEFEMGRKGFGWNERMTLSRQTGARAQHHRVFSKTGKVRARAKCLRAYFVLFMQWAAHQNDSLVFRNTHVALNHTACTEEERWAFEKIIQTNVQRFRIFNAASKGETKRLIGDLHDQGGIKEIVQTSGAKRGKRGPGCTNGGSGT